MPIVLDTHAWVWWVTHDRRLSRTAARAIRGAVAGGGASLSLISVWEVAKKVEKRQLVLDRPVRRWIEQAISEPGIVLVDLTPTILMDSCELPQPFHGDPADQMIVATARHLGAALVTRDDRLRKYPHVKSLW